MESEMGGLSLSGLIFTYGTLKTGFSNHVLMEELISSGDASLVSSSCTTEVPYPLVCGPYCVPFLIDLPGCGPHRVEGELYSVSEAALHRLDALEGTTQGHYQRSTIRIVVGEEGDLDNGTASVQAYFAHSSYALKLWNKGGSSSAVPCYTHEVARGYVKRSDRPHNLTFLQHIHAFLGQSVSPFSST